MSASFLTPREVAERWGCSARHIRRLCGSGELRAMRLGLESWRISMDAVSEYEQRHTSEPAAPAPTAAPKTQEVRPTAVVDGFTLPADYTPCFPDLWPGHAPQTKKGALSSH